MAGRIVLSTVFAASLCGGLASAALAQTIAPTSPAPTNPVQPQPRDPNMPAPQNTIPEKIDQTGTTGTLSERLEKSDGVIRPNASIDPGIAVRPPVPEPGTTPVIRPPGSPGGDQSVQPK